MTGWRLAGWTLVLLSIAMVLLLSHKPASAQPACGPLPDLLERLRDRFKEFAVFAGNAPEGQIIVTLSDDGDFTIIHAKEGLGCVLATGKHGAFDRGI
jgi:hypothetical protein